MKTFILVIVGGSTSLVGSRSDKHRSSFSSIERIARISIELPSKVRSRFEMQQWLNLEASIHKLSGPFLNGFPSILNPLVLKTLMNRRACSSRMCDLKRQFLISAYFNGLKPRLIIPFWLLRGVSLSGVVNSICSWM